MSTTQKNLFPTAFSAASAAAAITDATPSTTAKPNSAMTFSVPSTAAGINNSSAASSANDSKKNTKEGDDITISKLKAQQKIELEKFIQKYRKEFNEEKTNELKKQLETIHAFELEILKTTRNILTTYDNNTILNVIKEHIEDPITVTKAETSNVIDTYLNGPTFSSTASATATATVTIPVIGGEKATATATATVTETATATVLATENASVTITADSIDNSAFKDKLGLEYYLKIRKEFALLEYLDYILINPASEASTSKPQGLPGKSKSRRTLSISPTICDTNLIDNDESTSINSIEYYYSEYFSFAQKQKLKENLKKSIDSHCSVLKLFRNLVVFQTLAKLVTEELSSMNSKTQADKDRKQKAVNAKLYFTNKSERMPVEITGVITGIFELFKSESIVTSDLIGLQKNMQLFIDSFKEFRPKEDNNKSKPRKLF